MNKDLIDKAIEVHIEAFRFEPLKSFEQYYARVYHECIGMIFPFFRNRTFWLKAVRMLDPYVPVKYAFQILSQKNKIYGNRQLYLMGTLGILIRSIDKIERIKNITEVLPKDFVSESDLLKNETLADSYVDLFNYAILAVLLIDRKL